MKLIRGGKIFTGKKVMEKGEILIGDDGKIKEIGKKVKVTKDVEVIDVKDTWITPGLIDAHCHVGMWEEGIGIEGADGNESTSPVTPHLRAIDGINPVDLGFRDALKGGVTAVMTGPGSANVIGGLSLIMWTGGSRIVDELVIKNPAGLKMALGENPKRVYMEQKKMPTTRMGSAALIREAFYQAKEYMEKKKKKKGKVGFNLKNEALALVLQRKIKARAHAHRADDIATFVRIRDEFGFDLVIEHGTEAHLIADYLAKKKVPVVVGPSLSARVKVELKEITFDTPRILREHGVEIAIMTDAPVIPVNYLRLMVGLSIKHGLPWDEGLKAVTISAARICGVDKVTGSLEKGKYADIAIWDGDPFDIHSNPIMTLVKGEVLYRA